MWNSMHTHAVLLSNPTFLFCIYNNMFDYLILVARVDTDY